MVMEPYETSLGQRVKLYLTLSGSKNEFPKYWPHISGIGRVPFNIELLERVINDAFIALRGKKIAHEFFVKGSQLYPPSHSFFVFGFDTSGHVGYGNNPNVPTNGLLADDLEYKGFKFVRHNTIWTSVPYSGQGLMSRSIDAALEVDKKGNKPKPAVLMTTSTENHERYQGKCYITHKFNRAYVHGCGFRDKTSKKDLFPDATAIFNEVGPYIVSFEPKLADL